MAAAVILPPIAREGSFSLKLNTPPRDQNRARIHIDEDYLGSPPHTPLSRKRKEISPLDPSVLFPSIVRTPPSPSPSTQRTKKYARFDTGPKPDSNLSTLESARLPYPAHTEHTEHAEYTDEALVSDIQTIMNDLERISERIKQGGESRFRQGYQYALQSVLNTCTSQVDDYANYQIDAGVIPLTLRDYMSALLGHKPDQRKYPDKWATPPFEEAEKYLCELWRKEESVIHFGNLTNTRLLAVLNGNVPCVGDGENDLFGKGTLNLVFSPHVTQKIPVHVLGSVVGTGTAILLDKDQNVWFYNVPNSVDRHLDAMLIISAAQVMDAGDVITDSSAIVFLKTYTKAFVELDEVSDDDDEEEEGDEE